MSYKTIIVLLNDSAHTHNLMAASGAMALQHQAHLIGLFIIPSVMVYPDWEMSAPEMIFDGYRDLIKSRVEMVRKSFDGYAQQNNLKAELRVVDSNFPQITDGAIINSHNADLLITSQVYGGENETRERGFTERLIMESARPVLLIPQKPMPSSRKEGVSRKAIIGINGTRESARAMLDAVPLLKTMSETRLVWVDPCQQGKDAAEMLGVDEAAVLSRHGVKSVAEPMMTEGLNAGEALLRRANELGANLLVMGAYAHSRMTELVFGGATRHVLANMNIPVLMSH